MAAAYAGVVSVMHLMDQIQSYHARQPVFLDKQLTQLKSIQQSVSFLQDFLEGNPTGGSNEAAHLESQIVDITNMIEDLIESHIVDNIHARSEKKMDEGKEYSEKKRDEETDHDQSTTLFQLVQELKPGMDMIKKEVMLLIQKRKIKDLAEDDSKLESHDIGNDTMVGSDEKLIKMLIEGPSSLQIIQITGKNGVGKTTLAKNAYNNTRTVDHFDIRCWITISKEYNVLDILEGLLLELKVPIGERKMKTRYFLQLGQKLDMHLRGRRYIIVLDDMLNIEAWNYLRLSCPDNDNGSRIIVTTSRSNVVDVFGSSNLYEMKLNERGLEVEGAYAVVDSFLHLMDQIQFYYVRRPIFLVNQLRQLESMQQIVSLLQDFLEGNSDGGIEELEHLESRILDAAYAVEVIVESHIGDDSEKKMGENRDCVQSTSQEKESPNDFSQGLQKVIEEMDFIKREVMLFTEKSKLKDDRPRDLEPIASLESPDHVEKDTVVAFDENLVKIIEMLTKEQSSLQIIPITGMGGIGKTTLAKNAYFHTSIMRRFDFRGWATISQEFSMLNMLSNILEFPIVGRDENTNYHELGQQLHKKLSSRRYLMILDDMWSIDVWDKLSLFFPDNGNGSRIMITTRLFDVAKNFHNSNIYEMKLLDEIDSWDLLRKKVFAQKDCPPELEEVGKKIAKNCKGLPLSIGVIGGVLTKSNMTQKYWEYVNDDVSKTINSEDNERCFKILSLSYNHLPIHLKSCFLYVGVYPEDHNIRVSELIKLWVAEGILKPHRAKSLEEVAEDYLKDLIKRNLIFVNEFGSIGDMKYCKIHDLLRDLCLKEAEKETFLCVTKAHNSDTSQDMNRHRRIAIHAVMPNEIISHGLLGALRTTSFTFTRTFICDFDCDWLGMLNFRFLRVLKVLKNSHPRELIQVINTRYLRCEVSPSDFTSSLYLLWNLQVLDISVLYKKQPLVIWEMLQLRHVNSGVVELSDPPCCQKDEIDGCVLENLQSLSTIESFRCTEEVIKRIPNIKKLKLIYWEKKNEFSHYKLNNLERLYKLRSLHCEFYFLTLTTPGLLQHINFPDYLRKLTLIKCGLDGEGITTKIGSLAHLEKLKLISCYTGEDWNTVEGQFLSLRYLDITNAPLVEWTTDCTHFPCLECLVLSRMRRLKEIPYVIGEIETLRSIELTSCSRSAVASAKEILEEQQSLGNANFRLVLEEEEEEEEEEE